MTFDELHAAIAALVADEPGAHFRSIHQWWSVAGTGCSVYIRGLTPADEIFAATPEALLDAVRAAIAAHRAGKEQA